VESILLTSALVVLYLLGSPEGHDFGAAHSWKETPTSNLPMLMATINPRQHSHLEMWI
jgi:hypothetical protein